MKIMLVWGQTDYKSIAVMDNIERILAIRINECSGSFNTGDR
jgi:hypothetical protein